MISTQDGSENTAQPVFQKVGECLYKNQSSGVYYGLVQRCGKQFRRSLKTNDRQLANRRLSELRDKVGRLSNVKSARRITFADLADRRFGTIKGLKPLSAGRVETCIIQLKPYFSDANIRNITRGICDEWATNRGGKISPPKPNLITSCGSVAKACVNSSHLSGFRIAPDGPPHVELTSSTTSLASRAPRLNQPITREVFDTRCA